ncbi:MAG: hypothetical protein Q4B71_00360 [Cardiobacteriaceae bacterium]|nr:hypothetical protein [Cardiobacteriaceae bacterium]
MEKWLKPLLLAWFCFALLLLATCSSVNQENAKRFEEACAKAHDGKIYTRYAIGGITCHDAK